MKSRITVDAQKIKALIKQSGRTYSEISDDSDLSEDQIKNIVSGRTRKIAFKDANDLAYILGVSMKLIIVDDGIHFGDIPFNCVELLERLYKAEGEDVFPSYTRLLHDLKEKEGFKKLMGQAKTLATIVALPRESPDFSDVVNAVLETIGEEFAFGREMFTICLLLPHKETECLFIKVREAIAASANSHKTFLFFFYSVILFEAVLWQELMLVALLISPERARQNGTVGKCAEIAANFEMARSKLSDMIINGTYQFDNPAIESTGLDNSLFECAQLLILACNKCVNHFTDSSVSSRHVNISVLFEIREIVFNCCDQIGINIDRIHPRDVMLTFFGNEYLKMRSLYQPAPDLMKKKNDDIKNMNEGICLQQAQQQQLLCQHAQQLFYPGMFINMMNGPFGFYQFSTGGKK